MSVKRYLLSPENLIEVTVMVLLAIILYLWDDNINHDLKRILAAYAIVLSWAELIVLVGKHPKLSRLNVYATMFFKVCSKHDCSTPILKSAIMSEDEIIFSQF